MSRKTARRLPQLSGLFLKIFFGVWGSMTVAGIILLAIERESSEQSEQRWQRVVSESFTFYAVSAVQEHAEGKAPGLRKYLSNLQRHTGIYAWLFNEQGRELSGHAPARLQSNRRWMDGQLRRLTARARNRDHTEFERVGQTTLAIYVVRLPGDPSYLLVGELPAVRYDLHQAQPSIQALRLLAVLLMSGLISWVLSRHIATPIEKLRATAQRLAEGQLSARSGSELGERSDELGHLSHDFDRMADSIETLLREQDRMLGAQRRFLRDISHELRSPLARLGVALELARDRVEEMQPHVSGHQPRHTPLNEVHNRIEREAGHLNDMIDRLLALSRLESGVQRTEAESVDLAALIEAVAIDARFEAHRKQCEVEVIIGDDCDNGSCITIGTNDLLRSAIENVIRNAVHHTRQHTTVAVELRRKGAQSFITVRDHGPGVPEQELGDLFQPFFRTGRARDHNSGGTGLGLAITERAVQLHNGTVKATNDHDGGLIVEISLP